MLPHQQCHF